MAQKDQLNDTPHFNDIVSALPNAATKEQISCALAFLRIEKAFEQTPEKRDELLQSIHTLQKSPAAKPFQKIIETFQNKFYPEPPNYISPRSKTRFDLADDVAKLCLADSSVVKKSDAGSQGVYLFGRTIIKSLTPKGFEEEMLIAELFKLSHNDRMLPPVPTTPADLRLKAINESEIAVFDDVSRLNKTELEAVLKNLKHGFTQENYEMLSAQKGKRQLIVTKCTDSLSPTERKEFAAYLGKYWDVSYGSHIISTSFYTLQKTYLEMPKETSYLSLMNESERQKLLKFFQLPWSFRLGTHQVTLEDLGPEKMLVTKRCIHGLQLMYNLTEKPELSEHLLQQIFNSISADCELALLLTAEFQFLDYHTNNIGFELQVDEKNPCINYTYTVGNDTYSLYELARQILFGKISKEHVVTIRDPKTNSTISSGKIADQGNLIPILSHWKVVIFDADVSMGEDNELGFAFEKSSERLHHMIPLRSALLATPWAQKPLKKEALNKLLDPTREQNIFTWLRAPQEGCLQHIDKTLRQELLEMFQKMISEKEYRLTEARSEDLQNRRMTWQDLVSHRCANIKYYGEFWERVQKCVQHSIDLNAETEEAEYERIKIVKTMAPKASPDQIAALQQRFESRRTYFKHYDQLKGDVPLSKDALTSIIQHESTPLSTPEREHFMTTLNKQEANLQNIRMQLGDRIQPSYTTIAQSMYPLLADCMVLYKQTYTKLGNWNFVMIGDIKYSIETISRNFVMDNKEIQKLIQQGDMGMQCTYAEMEEDFQNVGKIRIDCILQIMRSIIENLTGDTEKTAQSLIHLLERITVRRKDEKKPFFLGCFDLEEEGLKPEKKE
jgi:hypothetical protein